MKNILEEKAVLSLDEYKKIEDRSCIRDAKLIAGSNEKVEVTFKSFIYNPKSPYGKEYA